MSFPDAWVDENNTLYTLPTGRSMQEIADSLNRSIREWNYADKDLFTGMSAFALFEAIWVDEAVLDQERWPRESIHDDEGPGRVCVWIYDLEEILTRNM